MNFLTENWGTIATALFALSEVLALVPGIKSNSIFQLALNLLKTLKK